MAVTKGKKKPLSPSLPLGAARDQREQTLPAASADGAGLAHGVYDVSTRAPEIVLMATQTDLPQGRPVCSGPIRSARSPRRSAPDAAHPAAPVGSATRLHRVVFALDYSPHSAWLPGPTRSASDGCGNGVRVDSLNDEEREGQEHERPVPAQACRRAFRSG